jgi:hypothetical protein
VAIELGSAYFTLLPSMAGTAAAVKTGLGATAVTSSFTQGGAAGGAAMAGGVAAGLAKAAPIIAAGVAAIGIAGLFSDSINAASDLSESANAIRVSFGDAAGEIEALGETAASRLGLSQKDFNSLAVRFSGFAGTIAGEGGKVGDVIDELTTRGADFASVYNIEAADALQLFQSGLAGESEPLRRFGVDISAATVASTAYRLGIAEVGSELTEQEKVQARYAAILEQTSQVEGDRAFTADEYANQQRENAAKWEDSLARIGEALLPAATQFANFVGSEENVDRLDRLIDLFIELEPAISGVADAVLVLSDGALAELDTIVGFFAALEDGKVTVEELLALMQGLPANLQGLPVAIANFMAGAINPVIGAINGVADAAENVLNAINSALGTGASINFPSISPLLAVGVSGPIRGVQTRMADGGVVDSAGWSWVGERGPELMYLPQDAQIHPLDNPSGGFPQTVTLVDRDGAILGLMDVKIGGYDNRRRQIERGGVRKP